MSFSDSSGFGGLTKVGQNLRKREFRPGARESRKLKLSGDPFSVPTERVPKGRVLIVLRPRGCTLRGPTERVPRGGVLSVFCFSSASIYSSFSSAKKTQMDV